MNLSDLINYNESDWLDFKSEWHSNTADLVLDILCLANSDAKTDRYLIIGYNENSQKIVNLTSNRKNRDELSDILSKANFNRIPTINLQTIQIDNQELDIVTIAKTNYRPYFLTKDKQFDKTLVRSGVIYTRNGSVNTPKDSSASENQIADMWRERFGLTLSPMERLQIYIQDTDNWKQVENPLENSNDWAYYYDIFPEFTIIFRNIPFADYDKSIKSYKVYGKTIGSSSDSHYIMKYHTTILDSGEFTIMDNHRNYLIDPDIRYVWYGNRKPCSEIHVETENAFVTDTGIVSGEALNRINLDASVCNRATISYHLEGSFKHGLQKILDDKIYTECMIYPYDFDDEKKSEQIQWNIYLIPKNENITSFIRKEVLRLLKLDVDPNQPS